MKKGFTLAELIGVLVVLALIAMIAIPSVTTTIKNNKAKICIINFENIINDAKNWASNNITKLPKEGENIEISFSDLVKYGYSEKELVNTKTGEAFPNSWKVVINNINNNFDYAIYNGNNYIDYYNFCK